MTFYDKNILLTRNYFYHYKKKRISLYKRRGVGGDPILNSIKKIINSFQCCH